MPTEIPTEELRKLASDWEQFANELYAKRDCSIEDLATTDGLWYCIAGLRGCIEKHDAPNNG